MFSCCCPCIIAADTFLYTGSPPSSRWATVVGDWTAAYGSITTGSNAMLISAQPSTTYNLDMQVNVIGDDGDEIKLYINYLDSSNHCYALFRLGAYCSETHQVSGGVDTLLQKAVTDIAVNPTGAALLLQFGTDIFGDYYIGINYNDDCDYAGLSALGLDWGFGTGTVASSVTFSYAGAQYNNQTNCPNGGIGICYSNNYSLVNCQWEMISGSFTGTNEAIPSGAGAMMLSQVVNPYKTGACTITFQIYMDSGDECDVIWNYIDSDNYCYIHIEGTYWFCYGYSVSSGTPTLLNQFQAPPVEGNQTFQIDHVGDFVRVASGAVHSGIAAGFTMPLTIPQERVQYGMRCPVAPSGAWKITNYTWGSRQFFVGDTNSAGCGVFGGEYFNQDCQVCSDPTIYDPPTVKVMFTGVVGSCASVNGVTYELPRIYGLPNVAVYQSGDWLPFCGGASVLTVGFNFDTVYSGLEVEIDGGAATWAHNYALPCNWTTYTFGFGNMLVGTSGAFAGATITVDFT